MKLASMVLEANKNSSCIAQDNNKGSNLYFENSEQMNSFTQNSNSDGLQIAFNLLPKGENLNEMVGGLGTVIDDSTILAFFGDVELPASISFLGTAAGLYTAGVNGVSLYKNSNLDTKSNFVISVISLFDAPGAIVALGLSCMKDASNFGAELTVNWNRVLDDYFVNYMIPVTNGY